MTSSSACRLALVALGASALAALGPQLTAARAGGSLVCGNAVDGHFSYHVTSYVTSGRHHKATMTPSAGDATLGFSLSAPSCPQSRYALTFDSIDGTPLGWSTRSAQAYVGSDLENPDAAAMPATTQVSPDGAHATVTFTGDGVAQTFVVKGITAGYPSECLRSSGVITNPDGTTQTTARAACSGGADAGSYW